VASKRERVLSAVFAALQTVPGATVRRNEALPQAVPAGGLIIMRDGTPGEPDVTLNPRTEYYSHAIDVEAFAPDNDSGALDDLLRAVDAALSADDSFGGLVEYLAVGDVEVDAFAGDGAAPMLAARINVIVEYQTSGALA